MREVGAKHIKWKSKQTAEGVRKERVRKKTLRSSEKTLSGAGTRGGERFEKGVQQSSGMVVALGPQAMSQKLSYI